MSKQLNWYLIVRDITISIICLYAIITSSNYYRKSLYSNFKEKGRNPPKFNLIFIHTVTFGCNVLIGLSLFLRVGGAGCQYVTGKLKRSCFAVNNGALVQTPFSSGCMRDVDYFIIVLTVISMCFGVIPIVVIPQCVPKIFDDFSITTRYFGQIVSLQGDS